MAAETTEPPKIDGEVWRGEGSPLPIPFAVTQDHPHVPGLAAWEWQVHKTDNGTEADWYLIQRDVRRVAVFAAWALAECARADAAEKALGVTGRASGDTVSLVMVDARAFADHLRAIAREREERDAAVARAERAEAAERIHDAAVRARDEQWRALLAPLLAEVADQCDGPRDSSDRRFAADEEPVCGKPARWGILTGWTCDEHRRPEDKNEIGSAALLAVLDALRGGAR